MKFERISCTLVYDTKQARSPYTDPMSKESKGAKKRPGEDLNQLAFRIAREAIGDERARDTPNSDEQSSDPERAEQTSPKKPAKS